MRFILLKSVIDIRINLNKDKRFASAKFSRRQYSLRTSGEELEIFLTSIRTSVISLSLSQMSRLAFLLNSVIR